MSDRPLSTLIAAWNTTMVAVTLLIAALFLSPFWDAAIFWDVLQNTLTLGR